MGVVTKVSFNDVSKFVMSAGMIATAFCVSPVSAVAQTYDDRAENTFELSNGSVVYLRKAPDSIINGPVEQEEGRVILVTKKNDSAGIMSQTVDYPVKEETVEAANNASLSEAVNKVEHDRASEEQEVPTWNDMLEVMMGHSRGFTEEEAKIHSRVLEEISVVEEENLFGL